MRSPYYIKRGGLFVPRRNRLIYSCNTPQTVTGTTDETTVATYVFPGGIARPNSSFFFMHMCTMNNDGSNKSIRVRLNGTQISIINYANSPCSFSHRWMRFQNSITAQGTQTNNTQGYGDTGSGFTNTTIDFNDNVTWTVTLDHSDATDTMTLEFFGLWFYQ